MRHVENWSTEPRAQSVRITADAFVVELVGGGSFAVPLTWYPRIRDAAPADRASCEVFHHGLLIRWPTLKVQFFVSILASAKVPLEPWDDENLESTGID